jgi:hypothetical protein
MQMGKRQYLGRPEVNANGGNVERRGTGNKIQCILKAVVCYGNLQLQGKLQLICHVIQLKYTSSTVHAREQLMSKGDAIESSSCQRSREIDPSVAVARRLE